MVSVLSNLVHFLLALPVLALGAARRALPTASRWRLGRARAARHRRARAAADRRTGARLAALHAHFKDVRDLLASVLTLLFFLTPILYPLAGDHDSGARLLVVRQSRRRPSRSPTRSALFDGRFPPPALWLEMALLAARRLVALGCWLFDRLRDTLVEAV